MGMENAFIAPLFEKGNGNARAAIDRLPSVVCKPAKVMERIIKN